MYNRDVDDMTYYSYFSITLIGVTQNSSICLYTLGTVQPLFELANHRSQWKNNKLLPFKD